MPFVLPPLCQLQLVLAQISHSEVTAARNIVDNLDQFVVGVSTRSEALAFSRGPFTTRGDLFAVVDIVGQVYADSKVKTKCTSAWRTLDRHTRQC
jgi:hypothetical protein